MESNHHFESRYLGGETEETDEQKKTDGLTNRHTYPDSFKFGSLDEGFEVL